MKFPLGKKRTIGEKIQLGDILVYNDNQKAVATKRYMVGYAVRYFLDAHNIEPYGIGGVYRRYR